MVRYFSVVMKLFNHVFLQRGTSPTRHFSKIHFEEIAYLNHVFIQMQFIQP